MSSTDCRRRRRGGRTVRRSRRRSLGFAPLGEAVEYPHDSAPPPASTSAGVSRFISTSAARSPAVAGSPPAAGKIKLVPVSFTKQGTVTGSSLTYGHVLSCSGCLHDRPAARHRNKQEKSEVPRPANTAICLARHGRQAPHLRRLRRQNSSRCSRSRYCVAEVSLLRRGMIIGRVVPDSAPEWAVFHSAEKGAIDKLYFGGHVSKTSVIPILGDVALVCCPQNRGA